MDQLFKKWLPSKLDDSSCTASGPTALGMLKVSSVFFILCIGAVIAGIIMMLELLNQAKEIKKPFLKPLK